MTLMTVPEIFRSITHTVTRVVGMVPASDYDEAIDRIHDLTLESAIDQAVLQAAYRRIRETRALERLANFIGLEDVVITDEIEPGMISYGVNFDMSIATPAFEKLGLRFEEIVVEEDITEKITSDEPVKGTETLGEFVTGKGKFADPVIPEHVDPPGVLDKAIDDFPADDGVAPEPYPYPGKAEMEKQYRAPTEHVDPPGYKPPTAFNVGGKKFKGER